LNIPIFEVEGFEADDVIGTLAVQAVGKSSSKKALEVVIVTGDQDAMQLVNGQVKVFVPGRGKRPAKMYGSKEVRERYQLSPEQIVDLKALAGDASDNIPGVKGIGPKTAVSLINKFGGVEGIYKAICSDLSKTTGISKSVLQKLVDGYEEAMRSKKLAKIVTDVPIRLNWHACAIHDYDKTKAVQLFKELGFNSLIKKLPNDDLEEMAETVLVQDTKAKDESNNQMELF
jgi:DNA polymerase-1